MIYHAQKDIVKKCVEIIKWKSLATEEQDKRSSFSHKRVCNKKMTEKVKELLKDRPWSPKAEARLIVHSALTSVSLGSYQPATLSRG